ncbi:MAG: hypothetical protein KL787_03015 [Taibaiella sp.]|nr:hypothetical protein [Taibaiella sp.]
MDRGIPVRLPFMILTGTVNSEKLSNFQSENAHAFAPVDNDILLIKSARTYSSPVAQWFKVGTETNTIVGEGTYNAVDLAGNGELATSQLDHPGRQ